MELVSVVFLAKGHSERTSETEGLHELRKSWDLSQDKVTARVLTQTPALSRCFSPELYPGAIPG